MKPLAALDSLDYEEPDDELRDPREFPSEHGEPVRRLDYFVAAALDAPGIESFDDELIEGILTRNGIAVLYGDSNSGKTFAAIDMAAAVSNGTKWLWHSTVQGLVVYLATESPKSVEMRVKAYQKHFGVKLPNLFIVRSPVNLFDGEADVTAIAALVDDIERERGEKVVLLIGDTLARISAGANENSGEDMGAVVRNVEKLRAAVGCAFVLIHHTGKDAAKGMRGWSGLRAAIDTEIEVTADAPDSARCLEVTKQRDLPGKGERSGFRLESVYLGTNRWGNPRSSCVVLPTDAPKRQDRGRRHSEIAGAVIELLTRHGTGMRRTELREHFKGRYHTASVDRELKKMRNSNRITETNGFVALIRQHGGAV